MASSSGTKMPISLLKGTSKMSGEYKDNIELSYLRKKIDSYERLFNQFDERIAKLEIFIKNWNPYNPQQPKYDEAEIDNIYEKIKIIDNAIVDNKLENSTRVQQLEEQVKKLTLFFENLNQTTNHNEDEDQDNNLGSLKYSKFSSGNPDKQYHNKEVANYYNSLLAQSNSQNGKYSNGKYKNTSPEVNKKKIYEDIENLKKVVKQEKDKTTKLINKNHEIDTRHNSTSTKANIVLYKPMPKDTQKPITSTTNTPAIAAMIPQNEPQQQLHQQQAYKSVSWAQDTGLKKTHSLTDLFSEKNSMSNVKTFGKDRLIDSMKPKDYGIGEYGHETRSATKNNRLNRSYDHYSEKSFSKTPADKNLNNSLEKESPFCKTRTFLNSLHPDDLVLKNRIHEEKKHQIDLEIETRIKEDEDRRKKIQASQKNISKAIDIKKEGPIDGEFKAGPFSTVMTRNREFESRLKAEKKLKNELIDKLVSVTKYGK